MSDFPADLLEIYKNIKLQWYLDYFLVEQPLQRGVGGVGKRRERRVLPHHLLPVLCHDGRAQHRRRATVNNTTRLCTSTM